MAAIPIPRSQVGIQRLPARRMSSEPRESMNCKSCRKRKVCFPHRLIRTVARESADIVWLCVQIKCNRLRPTCEACQVFQCPCVYGEVRHAVPKKRGPKTDVLDALLKRVDGLEAKLKDKNAHQTTRSTALAGSKRYHDAVESHGRGEPVSKRTATEARLSPGPNEDTPPRSSVGLPLTPHVAGLSADLDSDLPALIPEAVLDTYFARFHAKPYHILDEGSIRRRIQLGQLPDFLEHAIWAVASRSTPHIEGHQAAVKLGEEYAILSRTELDTDEPSIDGLQAALLLVIAFLSAGRGNRAYMLLVTSVGMAMALEMHRETDQSTVAPVEREIRRRLFWSCYLLDRFMACGSKRPSLISDQSIVLRLPSWTTDRSSALIQGDFFQPNSNLQYFHGSGKRAQGSTGMLIDIARILGTTNRYLAAGGVRGDPHFPWHSLSNLSKIRQDLDTWASGTDGVFSSLEALFGQSDSTVLVLSKLIYHLVYCLIYRPFLPTNLAGLMGAAGQHESWQIEATNMCFLHANAIAELVELGKQAGTIEWPAFVGYCICTAGTVHIHGAHYSRQQGGGTISREMAVFNSSSHFLYREMQYLDELRCTWASVQHQRDILQSMYNAHEELVKSSMGNSNTMRYAQSFHLEDFFERYANIDGSKGQNFHFDAAHLNLRDAAVDLITVDTLPVHDLYTPHSTTNDKKDASVQRRDRNALLTIPASVSRLNSQTPNSEPQDMSSGGNTGFSSMIPNLPGNNNTALSPRFNNMMGDSTSYDPMFGTLPTNACGTPAALGWQANDAQQQQQQQQQPEHTDAGAPVSPGTGSATAHDDKDPFLSLLEQLAEDEQRVSNGGPSELDFFLAGGTNP
ncbi:LOW QUALITY PROTEIN: Fungal trans [Geosmithia morbida]|uniref:Fungal trans n=1 Tax=Geosmithia morbida TaxID=1094350 RepID=A0A9P5D209_9HYPO|nr:LOW QUALITY PROTEIN: Fungal trans [Geosmithia morbida]KAF4121021.1 LOW QUALITY PROTEIN: Fungal trans [Geosmithia morbida]